jgi:hypothetical protein
MISNRFFSEGPGEKNHHFNPLFATQKIPQKLPKCRSVTKDPEPFFTRPGCRIIQKFEQPLIIPENPLKISYCFSGNVSTFC